MDMVTSLFLTHSDAPKLLSSCIYAFSIPRLVTITPVGSVSPSCLPAYLAHSSCSVWLSLLIATIEANVAGVTLHHGPIPLETESHGLLKLTISYVPLSETIFFICIFLFWCSHYVYIGILFSQIFLTWLLTVSYFFSLVFTLQTEQTLKFYFKDFFFRCKILFWFVAFYNSSIGNEFFIILYNASL